MPSTPHLALVSTPDTEARSRALDPQRSFLVEAPAGSGKTGLLIQRLLTLLAHDSVTDPAQVLAITFTLKATAELRERVLNQLLAARDQTQAANKFDEATRPLAEAVLRKDAAAGWNLLESPNRLNIRTIDSVCAQIAGSLPVLSGSGGAAPTDDAATLYQAAARRTLMQLGGRDEQLNAALETLLLHRDGNLADCERLLTTMLGWRDQWAKLAPLTSEQMTDEALEQTVRPRLERALETIVCRALTRVQRLMPPAMLAELARLAHRMSEADGYNGAVSPLALCRELRSAPGQAAADLDHWTSLIRLIITPSQSNWRGGFNKNQVGFETTKSDRDDLKDLVTRLASGDRAGGDPAGLKQALCDVLALPPLHYPDDQWHIVKALFRVLSRALVELQLVFAETAQCDFTEVALLARAALQRDASGEEHSLATALGMSLQHLLIDEMQDTSTAQYELIELLTQHWDGASQTVFLVGDPKQSIYLFRQARVERFVATMQTQQLGDIPLTTLRLTKNFRSQRTLVEAFNDTFVRIFPGEADAPDAIPYVAATANRPATPNADLRWHANPIGYSEDRAESSLAQTSQTRAHADEIAHIAVTWRARPSATLAVLVRTRRHLLEVVAALRHEGIPYRAVDIEPLAERQEILDLVALTRALLHPADRTAWLAVLRAPWCGLTLADLHRLTGSDDPAFAEQTIPSLIAQRGHELSEDGCTRLARVWHVLEAAESQRGQTRLAEWVEVTWRALGAEAFAAGEALRNAVRFFDLLDRLEQPGARLDLALLDRRLDKLYAAPSVHPGAVDLLTIHKSKGLEWDVVFVPSLEKSAGAPDRRLLRWLELDADHDAETMGILAPIAARGKDAEKLNRWIVSVEKQRLEQELKRLFYVACTRAREELHLFAAPLRKKDDAPSVVAGTLLAAAWPAAEDHFRAAVLTMPTPQRAVLDTIAATAQPATIERIPDAYPARLPQAPAPAKPAYMRPPDANASFAARTFGNTVHALLELLAQRAASTSFAELLAELPHWSPRIATLLRAAGLAPSMQARLAPRILAALTATLSDPEGQWLLTPHPGAASEAVLPAPDAPLLRPDRLFHAGPTPLSTADTHLWIVDYKTATHSESDLHAFLAQERQRYAPQLEAYARHLEPLGKPIRLALFYPLLPRLIWWEWPQPS